MSGPAPAVFEVIPAIDLRGGRVVRLTHGDDDRRTVYGDDPVAVLERFAWAGVRRVHVVDLDAAFGEPVQGAAIRALLAAARAAGVFLQVGGGLRDRESVDRALRSGVDRAVVGSLLARDPDGFRSLAEAFPGRLVPALDIGGGEPNAETGTETARVDGWRRAASRPLAELCAAVAGSGCPAVLVTDIGRDGTMEGPNLDLARRVGAACRTPALVSGGVRSLDDLRAAREEARSGGAIGGAIVGRAIYEGRIDVAEAASLNVPPPSGLAARVIPCLDVAAGRVVKGVRFQDLRDVGDPAQAAIAYAEQGADEIVFLDITAGAERRSTDLEWVRRAAERVFVPLTVGGGVREVDDARRLLAAGADKVAVNSAAAARPELLGELARRYGSQSVVLSVDARRRAGAAAAWEVVVQGGRQPTGRDALDWIAEGVGHGAGEVLLTSIDSDGTREGYDLELLAAAARRVRVPIIASGGAGSPAHLAAALSAGAAAVLAASIFHDKSWTVGAVKAELAAAGHRVRELPEAAS